jgi:hypothetical protein
LITLCPPVSGVNGDSSLVSKTRDRKTMSGSHGARFKDSGPEDDVWIPWHKANELPALDRYSKEHPDLNIPDNQRNPADKRQSAPGGRGFLLRKGGVTVVLVVPSDPYYYYLTYS